jgi:hypothetical protein
MTVSLLVLAAANAPLWCTASLLPNKSPLQQRESRSQHTDSNLGRENEKSVDLRELGVQQQLFTSIVLQV